MAAETTRGIDYPTSGDNIAPLETIFANLANSADTAIGTVATAVETVQDNLDALELAVGKVPLTGAYTFTSPTNTTSPVSVTVPFTSGYFTTEPKVVATVAGTATTGGGYFPLVHSITTSQFKANIWRTAVNQTLGTCTISIASPAVITEADHGLLEGAQVYFTTTGALPTGISAGTFTSNNYYVRNPATNTFNISLTPTGTLINTSGTQSGVHTLLRAAQEPLTLQWIAK